MHGRARPGPVPSPLGLEVRRDSDRATVQVAGEIDMANAAALSATLLALLDDGCRTVELDLSGLRFLAAAGLAVLVEHDRRYRDAAAELLVRHPSRQCVRLLAMTGLTEVLTVR